ncbi:MAG: 8-oxo-dGTP diphosphatase [Candidatus Marinimicrobia bacterium]|nr:8-oxo-dGTP diphosphatase [Candidatus Neomarinimicrobiota bacterium]
MKLATLCYIQKDNKTLMIHRVKKENDMHMGKWNGLGGKIIPGETPEECVIREVEEESGLKIKNPNLKGFITFPAFDGFEDWYVFVYTATDFSRRLKKSDEGILRWINNSELLTLPLWDGDKIFLKWLSNDRLFSAKFIYKNGRLVEHNVVFYN